MTPLVSIVVPAYNAEKYLPELCDSIQAQTFPDFEVLLLDDGSSDATQTVLAPYLKDARFRLTSWSPNRGVSAASRALFAQMRGRYWCHPGADDALLPDFISERLALAEKHDTAIIHGPPLLVDEQSRGFPDPTPLPPVPSSLAPSRALSVLLEHNIINTPSIFIPTSVTKRVLPLFTGEWNYAQDWFLWILHVGAGCPLVWDATPRNYYRVHRSSLSYRADRAATREAEVRLAPFCALSKAAALSPEAAALWHQWRVPLYQLWLRRAVKLARAGVLKPAWMDAAASAFAGAEKRGVSLVSEVLKNLPGIVRCTIAERAARSRNLFQVSGCAEIQDPMFGKSSVGSKVGELLNSNTSQSRTL